MVVADMIKQTPNLQGGVLITGTNWLVMLAKYPVIDEKSKENLVDKYYFFPHYDGRGKWALIPKDQVDRSVS